jgi:hypothetical protein
VSVRLARPISLDSDAKRRLAADLLTRAIAAEGRRRGRGADAKVGRLARELVEAAVEKMP